MSIAFGRPDLRKHATFSRLCLPLAVVVWALSTFFIAERDAYAGGGPPNVIVLYNADDGDATAVAKYYEAARSLPVGHLCGLRGIDKTSRDIDVAKYKELVQKPFDACLAALPQPDDIDYVVLVRGLPYRVGLPSYTASLEALLQVHHVKQPVNGVELAGSAQPSAQPSLLNPAYFGGAEISADLKITNKYSGWYTAASRIVRAATLPKGFQRKTDWGMSGGGYKFSGNLFIVGRLDGFDYKDAKDLVDRAVTSDGSMPKGELLCMHGEDEARGARDPECEFTVRMLKGAGFNGVWLDPFDGALNGHNLSAYFSGSADTIKNTIAANTFAPGAITCNLTSTGADPSNFFCSPDGKTCPAAESQTSIARYVRAGATGASGAVNEPYNNVFPNAGAMLLYTFGYNLGESYFFNQRFLYWQNLYLGDPLATPYAQRPVVTVPAAIAAGVPTNISATHPDGVASVVIYLGGKRVAASGEGEDNVTFIFPGSVGDKLDVLAVATAKNAPAKRAGWANPEPKPQPDVQGWTAASRTIVASLSPDGDSGAGGVDSGGVAGGADSLAGGGVGGVVVSGASGAGGAVVVGGVASGVVVGGAAGPTVADASSGCGCALAGGDGSDAASTLLMAGFLAVAAWRRRALAASLRALSNIDLDAGGEEPN